jgi:hypothetical protein
MGRRVCDDRHGLDHASHAADTHSDANCRRISWRARVAPSGTTRLVPSVRLRSQATRSTRRLNDLPIAAAKMGIRADVLGRDPLSREMEHQIAAKDQ